MQLSRQLTWTSHRVKVGSIAFVGVFLLFFLHVSWQRASRPSPSSPQLHSSSGGKEYTGDYITGEGSVLHGVPPEYDESRKPTRPALIAAAQATEDVAWMESLASSYDLYPYNVDDRNTPSRLAIPANTGHEAMVYLTFIINNYEFLPPHAVFVHGHRDSWHQEADIVHLLKALRIQALQEVGYVPLRCDWYPSCPAEINPITKDGVVWGPGVHRQDAEDAIAEVWETFFPGVDIPHTIASQCCAQFAVTREAILRRPKEQYIIMREWLLNTDLHDDISGRVLEKLWAYIMTNDAVHCPSPQSCACNYFGHCEDHKWPKPPKALGELPADSNII